MENEKRLIDQGKVYQLACAGCTRHGETLGECNYDEPCERLIFAFTVAEPVDAVEVVHGRWIKTYTCHGEWLWGYECDQCKADSARASNYCPNCGAKMVGERKDNG